MDEGCNPRDIHTEVIMLVSEKKEAGSRAKLLRLIRSQPIPAIAAPMFLVSTPELVIASAKAGVIGGYPAPNSRTVEELEKNLGTITEALSADENDGHSLPWLLNMIVHSTYSRFAKELALVERFQPAVVTTALGSPKRVLSTVHDYGGLVLSDVATPSMARKAVQAGVDGLILVCAGAGGHTGKYSPFSFIAEVLEFWDGPIGLAGGISNGADILAAQALGFDFVMIGTRFIAVQESMASEDYRQMLLASKMEDIVASKSVSGVMANWLAASLKQAGVDEATSEQPSIDFSGNIAEGNKAWKHIWSAGHGVGQIKSLPTVSQLVQELAANYGESAARFIKLLGSNK